jgi:Sulfotransferase family
VPQGPIFIIGAMGSGTTLLRLMLDSHPNIAIPGETGFMRAYNAHQFIPFKWSGRNWAKRLGWSREELDRELAAFYERLFVRFMETHSKQRWGEKTPLHTFHVDDMARLFPEASFVSIVRHPGGEVASTMSRFDHSLGRATQHYQRYTRECIRQAARHADRFVLLRYEDLVLQPEALLRELLDWLDEPWSDQVLEHHTIDRGGKSVVEGGNRADDPIDTSRITKWTNTLDGEARAKVTRRLGRLGDFLGYSMADPARLEPLGATILAGGAEIDARIDRFPDLDLRTPVEVPAAERFYHPRDVELTRRAEPKQAVTRSPGATPEPPAQATPPPSPVSRRVRAAVRRHTPAPIKRRLRAAVGRVTAARG